MSIDTDIPGSWLECRLGEVVSYGATQKAEPSEIPDDAWVLELEDIEKDTSKILNMMTFKQRQSKSTKNRFSSGDVLYGKLRPYLNKVVRADRDGFCTTEIVPLKPNDIVAGSYLFYWLKHPAFLAYVSQVSHGLNMPRLGTDAGKNAPFVLAPVKEQKRIADKLDAVLGRVDACRERLDRLPAILKRFRQSVLAAATSGQLTEEWRIEHERHPSEWSQTTVGQLIEGIDAGLNVRCDERPPESGERGLVKISAVTWGEYDDSESKTLPRSVEISDDRKIGLGDFLISRANTVELVGACVIVHKVSRPVYLSDKVLRLRMPSHLKPWLLHVLQSPVGRRQIEELASGNQLSMRNLSQANLKSISVPLPRMDEMAEIVRRVKALLHYADRIEARYTTARTQIGRLTPALLAKAFRGELVPQDPNDEPALLLLQRLQTVRKVLHADGATEKLPGNRRRKNSEAHVE